MVKTYRKGDTLKLSDNFYLSQFDCKCHYKECDFTLIDPDLISNLDPLADLFGMITIDSGFRCHKHNMEWGGKPNSFHLQGMAADVKSMFAGVSEIYHASLKIDRFANGGIGIYTNWVHLDVRPGKVRWGNQSIVE